ncbi:MAG: hypothetical protein H7070_14815 [Saprospiraceae bacterium]|nr:hypothetical protein [Pyrinomonadaceae bacterium]
MSFQIFFKKGAAIVFGGLCVLTSIAAAQPRTSPTPTVVWGNDKKPYNVAERNNLYCAGYVQASPVNTDNRLVGAVQEQEQFMYAEGDVVYLNMGSNKGVQVGNMMSVVRPRGQVNSRWTRKDGLGFFVQEVGTLEIIRVKSEVSIARVKNSCDNFLLGDLVQPFQQRTSPVHVDRAALDLYADPTGKAMGRLFMARDNQEMVSREQIVYIDLGAEDNVQIGDYLTIFRPLGRGNLFISDEDESVSARDEGFQSNEYRGGKFSNQAARKSGDTAQGRVVTTEKAKEDRPAGLRKIVGEMVILNVKERTATAVITRTAQEIHTGDWVEVQ